MSVTTVVTRSAVETRAVAAGVGRLLLAGDVVMLSGDLGAGKTVFTKGLADALGVEEPVVSPTFAILREYQGTLPLVHVDVYRLDRVQELHDVGFDDLLGGPAVAVVEWGDRVRRFLPAERLEVHLELADVEPDERHIGIAASGASWRVRQEALDAVLASYRDRRGSGV